MIRVPLGPGDYCIYSQHRVGYVAFGAANIPYAMIELDGVIDPARLRDALAKVFRAHPVVMARLEAALLRLRPCWRLPSDGESGVKRAVGEAYSFDDLADVADCELRFAEMFSSRYTKAWNLHAGPQMRLEHYAIPLGRTRLVLRWPHYFADAEGGQLLLAELAEAAEENATKHGIANLLMGDCENLEPLKGVSVARRLELVRSGLSGQKQAAAAATGSILLANDRAFQDHRVLHRRWDSSEFERIKAHARELTPSGPAMHSRYVAACVFRALYRLYAERSVPAREFRITFPMRIGTESDGAEAVSRRPLPGNYLAAAVIRLSCKEAADRLAGSVAIERQLRDFVSSRQDLAQWALLEAAALLHHKAYDPIFEWGFVDNRYSSGFSYFVVHPALPRAIAGARVVNAWFGGPITTPPAWNPVFSRLDDTLSMSLTYSRPAVSDEMAGRYVELIAEELLDPS